MARISTKQSLIPPHDIDAEVCVLGSMLLDAGTVCPKVAFLTQEDFYRPAHGEIYTAIQWMAQNPARFGVPDLVTLKDALRSRGALCRIVGKGTEEEAIRYLIALVDGTPSHYNAEYYARIVRDCARLRAFIRRGRGLILEAYRMPAVDDFFARAGEDLGALCRPESRGPVEPAADLGVVMEEIIDGKRLSVQWPWPSLTYWGRMCAPGTVGVICGDPGSTKSFMLQQAMLHWHGQGIPVAVQHLEEDRTYHLTRALAQLDGNSNLTDDLWVRAHPADAKAAHQRHSAVLDSFGRCIWDDPGKSLTLREISGWVRARAAEGRRIIAVDPITAAAQGERSWEEDKQFVQTCKTTASRHKCTIILVTHPRIAQGRPSEDGLAGGRAYSRLTNSIIWIKVHYPPKESRVRTVFGVTGMEHNRSVDLLKTRDGKGRGLSLAFDFDGETLLMTEHGVIDPRKAKKHEQDDE